MNVNVAELKRIAHAVPTYASGHNSAVILPLNLYYCVFNAWFERAQLADFPDRLADSCTALPGSLWFALFYPSACTSAELRMVGAHYEPKPLLERGGWA